MQSLAKPTRMSGKNNDILDYILLVYTFLVLFKTILFIFRRFKKTYVLFMCDF